MAEASAMLRECIAAALAQNDLTEADLIVGGFSQGAMVTTSVTLSGLRPAVLAIFSGTLLHRTEWARQAEQHPGCRVVQSHGAQDPLLPMSAAVELKDLLVKAGFNLTFTEFQGGHTIPMPALTSLQTAIEACLQ